VGRHALRLHPGAAAAPPGPDVEVLARLDGWPIGIRQGNVWATTFHPSSPTTRVSTPRWSTPRVAPPIVRPTRRTPMSRTTRCTLLVNFALIIAAAGSAAPPSGAPAWDSKQVLALGVKLSNSLRDAEIASREAPAQATALQQRKRDAALTAVKQIRQSADAYVSKLRAGGTPT
jgi:hypothetical protein